MPDVRTPDEIREHLVREGLAAHAGNALARLRTEIRITTTRTESFALGQSRIGGVPDLPRGIQWPRHRWTHAETAAWPEWCKPELAEGVASGQVVVEREHFALAHPFVAQLDLAELAPLQAALPRTGRIWLFADQSTTVGEIAGYQCRASACVYDTTSDLVRAEPPPVPESLPASALAFTAELVLPNPNDAAMHGLSSEEWDTYDRIVTELGQRDPRHALLHQPDSGANQDIPPPGFTSILRVDSDYAQTPIINWGDAAWITFAIPDDALASCRFEEVCAFCWYG